MNWNYSTDNGNENGNQECHTMFSNRKRNSSSKNASTELSSNKDGVPLMMFENLRVGPTTAAASAAPTTDSDYGVDRTFLPSLIQPQKSQERQRSIPPATHLNGNRDHITTTNSSGNNYHEHSRRNVPTPPSHRQSPSRSTHDHNNRRRSRPEHHRYYYHQPHHHYHQHETQLKEPPAYSISPNAVVIQGNDSNKSYPKTKDPPKPGPALPSIYKKDSSDCLLPSHSNRDKNKNRNNHDCLAHDQVPRPAEPLSSQMHRKDSSIPRAINLSFERPNDPTSSLPAVPAISPISFSPSIFRKRTAAGPLYPSGDAIQEQLSRTAQEFLPRSVILPSTTQTGGDIPGNPSENQDAMAAATTSHYSTQVDPRSRLETRPQKPLRFDSFYPSVSQQKQQARPRSPLQQPRNLRTIPQQQVQQHIQQQVFPCPMPLGNGITNGTATSIHSKTNSRERKILISTQREYNLEALLPTIQKQHHKQGNGNGPSQQADTAGNYRFSNVPKAKPFPNPPANIAIAKNTEEKEVFSQYLSQDPSLPIPLSSSNPSNIPSVSHAPNQLTNVDAATRTEAILRRPPPTSSFSKSVKVEIYPGVFHVLRIGKGITLAVDRSFAVSCTCVACTTKHMCIADAAYTICPSCLVVYSLTEGLPDSGLGTASRWGVAMGFI